jgi:hypothetical protein
MDAASSLNPVVVTDNHRLPSTTAAVVWSVLSDA